MAESRIRAMTIECSREQDVIEAVTADRWPDRAAADLRTHVDSCPLCRDVAAVAAALQHDQAVVRCAAPLPPAGRVWWRAEMRARREAARHAAQPIGLVLGLAAACVAGLSVALVQAVWPRVSESFGVLAEAKNLVLFPQLELSLAIVAGICLLVAPLAAYLLFSDQ